MMASTQLHDRGPDVGQKREKKREKEYVSPAAAAYIQRGAEKRGHLSST